MEVSESLNSKKILATGKAEGQRVLADRKDGDWSWCSLLDLSSLGLGYYP